MVLRPCGGDQDLYKGFGWTGLKKIGVKISEVLKVYCAVAKDLLTQLQIHARQQGVSTETLINLWLREKVA